MKIKFSFFASAVAFVLAIWACTQNPEINADHLTCNFREQPLGVDSEAPLLGWQLKSSGNNVVQSAYRIIVAENPSDLENGEGSVWDSGKMESAQSINIPYPGQNIDPGKRYYWKVKVWDDFGKESSWSETSWWQSGLFSEKDWQGAKWIAYEKMDSSKQLVPGIHGSGDQLGDLAVQRPVVPQFRKTFEVKKELQSATLFISGLGQYEASLNGQKVGNSFLAPGWTDYDKTVFYNTYDVTSLLKSGGNVLGAVVGNGFYNINRERYRKLVIAFGFPKMIGKLQLNYNDGTSETLVTDESWKCSPSPTIYTSIYGGEDYDASMEQTGWQEPGFDDSEWNSVLLARKPQGKLVAENDYPLMEMETFEPEKIIALGDTAWLYDFGQNASGIVELKVKGTARREVKLWPSELINPDKSANQQASGRPYYFSYKLNGKGSETWKPRFTYYGFRYVQVSGAVPAGEDNPQELPEIEKLSFLHTRNSSPQNGTFECSNDLLNRTHTLIDWAIRSNFQSVLSDCPHREKLGWLEQTYLMGQGVHFRYDNYHLYRKLVFDMIDAQTEEGLVPDIAPEYVEFNGGFRDSPEWGSAAVFLPYLLWKWYDDKQIIADAWPMMMRYIQYLKTKSDGHILDYGLGDWFDLGPGRPGVSQLTPVALTATATYYYDVKLMAEMAALMGKPEKKNLNRWAEEVRSAFNQKFYIPETNVYSTGSQTAMSMPLCAGIPEEGDREAVFANLVDSIVAENKALTAGDVGFHYLVEALTSGGAAQLMYEMINRDDVPGYGFQLKKGATALTESWQALEIVSNNHLMLGHVMEWFYAGLGGISQADNSAGYKNILIQPQVVKDLAFVKVGFESPYGLIRSEWEQNATGLKLEVEIPHNTKATILLPTNELNSVRVNGEKPKDGIISKFNREERLALSVGSGKYQMVMEPLFSE
ncbi:family 78 glycoside hydrolase catalytic domain [Maribellus comscasis]|nr:family 78 glycoside hydrolase catalytic domain [Maribellus comscasis]